MGTARRRRALEIATSPDTSGDLTDHCDTATALDNQYGPEHQLIGALMWLTAPAAGALLDLVPDTAIYDPQTRWALELIRRVVTDGHTPTPPAVLAAGRRHPARDAADPHSSPTAAAQHRLALYLLDAYSQAIAPAVAAPTYAHTVLDDAYRRAVAAAGTRMHALAESTLDLDALHARIGALSADLTALYRRARTAARK